MPQRAISSPRKAENAAGVEACSSTACSANWRASSGSCTTRLISAFRRATTAAGVEAGTNTPCQVVAANFGITVSARVGTSGSTAARCGLVTAIARARPSLMAGSAVLRASSMKCPRPPIRSTMAGAVPLYGTCVACVPVSCSISSTARWVMLPTPPEP
ncbi:Uncharacterised protein [Bordetella pertussis]|nr:Uncharacterised protein [Bordetella pertussis]